MLRASRLFLLVSLSLRCQYGAEGALHLALEPGVANLRVLLDGVQRFTQVGKRLVVPPLRPV